MSFLQVQANQECVIYNPRRFFKKSNKKSSATLYDIADDFTHNSRRITLNHLIERIKLILKRISIMRLYKSKSKEIAYVYGRTEERLVL